MSFGTDVAYDLDRKRAARKTRNAEEARAARMKYKQNQRGGWFDYSQHQKRENKSINPVLFTPARDGHKRHNAAFPQSLDQDPNKDSWTSWLKIGKRSREAMNDDSDLR